MGREEDALRSYDEALQTARAAGDRTAEAMALTCLGYVRATGGRHEPALRDYERAR